MRVIFSASTSKKRRVRSRMKGSLVMGVNQLPGTQGGGCQMRKLLDEISKLMITVKDEYIPSSAIRKLRRTCVALGILGGRVPSLRRNIHSAKYCLIHGMSRKKLPSFGIKEQTNRIIIDLVAAVAGYCILQPCDKCSENARAGTREDGVGTAMSTSHPGATRFRHQNGSGRGCIRNNSSCITSSSQLS